MTVLKCCPKIYPHKTVDQIVRTNILAEIAFGKLSLKTTYWNAAQNCPQNQLFKMSVRKCWLTEKVSEKTTNKKDFTEMLPKMCPQKQPVKLSVPNC